MKDQVMKEIIGGMLPNQREILYNLADQVIEVLDDLGSLSESQESLLNSAFKVKGLECNY